MKATKLLLGVGNVLQRDDGVGVRAAQRMASWDLPPEVEVCDIGTAGLEAAAILEGRELVVVVDATDAGAAPGAVFRLSADQLRPSAAATFSLHDVHLLSALDETELLGTAPEKVIVLAVQTAEVSLGIDLSPPVIAALPTVLRLAAQELDIPAEAVEAVTTKNWTTDWRERAVYERDTLTLAGRISERSLP